MQHSVIGVKSSTGELIAFVDLSLQTSSGSDSALLPLSYLERKQKYVDLKPYICNLLVVPSARKQGLGSKLIAECEKRASDMGFTDIYLHADVTYLPAMKLYVNASFEPIQKKEDLLFMRKSLTS